MNNKQKLRNYVKEIRKQIITESLNKFFVDKIKASSEYKKARHIMLYYPKKDEVNLLELLQDKTKCFYLPRVNKENLQCCKFSLGDNTVTSNFGVEEPLTAPVDKSIIDLIIVPALACDKEHYRLGYGKGFYDRFLTSFKRETIMCVPKEFVFDTIYKERQDIPISILFTDE